MSAALHAVLPGDGVAVLRVVQEGHVDSNQRRPVSCQNLTADDGGKAVREDGHQEHKHVRRGHTNTTDILKRVQYCVILVPV